MSVYRHLGANAPAIAYQVLHQAKAGVAKATYSSTMKELHARIGEESVAINSAYQKFLREITTRESQILKGTIAQFLETPIRTDNAEVQRIFREAFEKFQDQVLDRQPLGVSDSSEGRMVFPSLRRAPGRKLLENGRAWLEKNGFSVGKGTGDVFESAFHVLGGLNLDILEHIVRDRLGIYSSTHGKHLGESARSAFTAYNVLHTHGNMPAKGTRSGKTGAALLFSKPSMEYAPFRKALRELTERHANAFPSIGFTLLQRKLGLGIGEEFMLRWVGESVDQVDDVVQGLREAPEPFLDSLHERGNLFIKEVIL